jgi:hypothetical protein
MDPSREVHGLTTHRGRTAGSDAERRAAKHLQGRLRALGREAETEATEIRPRYGLAHALHGLLAIAGSVIAVGNPVAGLALVAIAAVSATLDVAGVAHLLRRVTGRRASQNVVSREDAGKPGVLVLVAHYDAGRDDAAFARLGRVLRDPWAALVGATTLLLACCVLRVAGIDSQVVTVIQFVPTVVLILLTPLLVDLELSPPSRGEADDAGGVATVLRLAEDAGGDLEHFDLWVLLTGASKPFGLGMRRWLRRHREELDDERTVFVSIPTVGDGPLRYARREGPLYPLRARSQLVRLCRDIAEDAGADAPLPAVRRDPGDGAAALARGFPALSVWSEGRETDGAALDRAYAFTRELLRRLDAEVGPQLAERAPREAVRQA